ncbi:hypothetical protein AB0I27_23040 [Streptomyces sp. NPDC050597]|uniref:hypothetical protein n=1 Tax=Streptomyces sp. NPDC050597 TaxID=3157212 RepID=UPI00341501E7
MTALTVADMSTAFRALETVAENHPQLPAATFHVRGTTLGAEQVIDVQIREDADSFAAWCAALDIDTQPLQSRSTGFHYYTQAITRFAGVTFVIVLDHPDVDWRPAPVLAEAVAA